ncbi:MAG: citrate (Si)-synthase [Candidatus Calescibacterium sp.]|nr:citrate (Si)-synthase [Candidatus Calescibacterium sp.]MDW8132704.1 citrate (Si)-synthase [Candidatus Calescibacterium sp.]
MKLKVSLFEKMEDIVERWRKEYKDINSIYGEKIISDIKVSQVLGGMRDIPSLICETSFVDPYEGIKFRGYSISETLSYLPKVSDLPYVLGIWYLLLTGEIPSRDEVEELEEYIKIRERLPKYVIEVLRNTPANTHPMTQFAMAILAMQRESVFAKSYYEGMNKRDLWRPMLEDCINLIARAPVIAAYIYRRTYRDDVFVKPNETMDYGANFAHMLNVNDDFVLDKDFADLIRLYLILHSDHEGGNVSAHTCFNISSALSDIYYSVAGGMCGLAGPLHGNASSESLRWILNIIKFFNGIPSKEKLIEYIHNHLAAGKVIPGFGHAVLRVTDPRYTAFSNFVDMKKLDSDVIRMVKLLYEVVPDILKSTGKVKDPYPNVDGHSGAVLYHYNLKEHEFYTVMFGVSRIMGMTSQVIWARAVGFPIERPKSLTLKHLVEMVTKR